MEYLATYSWEILIIAIILVAMFELGLFSGFQLPSSCVAQPGFLCISTNLVTNGLLYATIGSISGTITLSGTACSNNISTPPQISSYVPMHGTLSSDYGSVLTFHCNLKSNTLGTYFHGTLWILYTSGNVESQIEVGSISADASSVGLTTTSTLPSTTSSTITASTSTTSTTLSTSTSSSTTSSSTISTTSSTSTSSSTTSTSTTSTTSSTTTIPPSNPTKSFNPTTYYSYSDVLLVCNPASQISLDVCTYFTNQRISEGFNASHILNLSGISTSEYVNDTVTQNILSQVKAKITSIGLGKIDYIVTTYGTPLVDSGNGYSIDSFMADNLTDAADGGINNPYYYLGNSSHIAVNTTTTYLQNHTFSWNRYHMYEVTRLDGPTLQSIYNLINDANNAGDALNTGYVLLDSNTLSINYASYYEFNQTNTILTNMGVNNRLVSTSFETGVHGLSGYASWGSNCDCTAGQNSSEWNLTFVPGAIGETFVSTSARTLIQHPWDGGQSLIDDLVMYNITGISGYVSEPYLSGTETINVLFPLYFSGMTLADSYYAAMPEIQWKSVVIGDPKAHLKSM